MLRLRPYKKCDAEKIVTWIKDERAFRQWSSDRFGDFPLSADELNRYYKAFEYADDHMEFTAYDEDGVCGHLIIRFTDEKKKTARLGFVIVDDKRRGQGLGKEMVLLAVKYAFGFLGAEKITLGVFDNNPAAHHCYLAAGFKEVGAVDDFYSYKDEKWRCTELEITKP